MSILLTDEEKAQSKKIIEEIEKQIFYVDQNPRSPLHGYIQLRDNASEKWQALLKEVKDEVYTESII